MHGTGQASLRRRIAAFAIDYAVIVVYIELLVSFGFAIRKSRQRHLALPWAAAEKIKGHALAFLTLTLPVVRTSRCPKPRPPGRLWENGCLACRAQPQTGSA